MNVHVGWFFCWLELASLSLTGILLSFLVFPPFTTSSSSVTQVTGNDRIANIHQGWGQGRLDGPRRRLIEMRRGVYTMEEAWEKNDRPRVQKLLNKIWKRNKTGGTFLIIVSPCYHKKSCEQKKRRRKKMIWEAMLTTIFVVWILEQRFNIWDDCNVCQLPSICMILNCCHCSLKKAAAICDDMEECTHFWMTASWQKSMQQSLSKILKGY